ncbi:MAG TPA: hypothetical protein PLP13_07130, partial [bacterium]|nr:hypothetical protein [bacterium]
PLIPLLQRGKTRKAKRGWDGFDEIEKYLMKSPLIPLLQRGKTRKAKRGWGRFLKSPLIPFYKGGKRGKQRGAGMDLMKSKNT